MKAERDIDQPQTQWVWNKSNKCNYLQCNPLLKEGFQHGFFNKNSDNFHPKELAASINSNWSVHLTKQVHSNRIVEAQQNLRTPHPTGDGILSTREDQSLWIRTADCIPILFAETRKGHTAAVHAGWKGLSKGIIFKTMRKLKENGGKTENILIALGPAISSMHYQFNKSLAEKIINTTKGKSQGALTTYFEQSLWDREILSELNTNKRKETMFFDIKELAINQMKNIGLESSQIFSCPLCTFTELDLFNSWRRDHRKAIQWSFIASNSHL